MNYFLDALKNKYANFSGRARRKEFWYFLLFMYIVLFVAAFIDGAIGTAFVMFIAYAGLIVPYFAVAVRRMHDVGKSGWFILIPLYNLILAVTEGEPGTNEYGPNPKNPELDDVMDHLVE